MNSDAERKQAGGSHAPHRATQLGSCRAVTPLTTLSPRDLFPGLAPLTRAAVPVPWERGKRGRGKTNETAGQRPLYGTVAHISVPGDVVCSLH